MAYDFRSRFNIGIDEIGERISYLEAIYLAAVLMRDPSSWLQAASSGWTFPVTQDWIVATQTYDLLAMANSKKRPKPYPLPWHKNDTKMIGSNRRQSRKTVIQRLRQMNPKENDG